MKVLVFWMLLLMACTPKPKDDNVAFFKKSHETSCDITLERVKASLREMDSAEKGAKYRVAYDALLATNGYLDQCIVIPEKVAEVRSSVFARTRPDEATMEASLRLVYARLAAAQANGYLREP